eukprot:4180513-Heterocapsa_arctica.AAC.1
MLHHRASRFALALNTPCSRLASYRFKVCPGTDHTMPGFDVCSGTEHTIHTSLHSHVAPGIYLVFLSELRVAEAVHDSSMP